MPFNDKIYLIDIEPVLDPNSGKNKNKIVRETAVYADLQDVGMEEYYNAVGNSILLSATYELPSDMYHGEKYILTADRKMLYEVSRVGKGHTPSYRRLPVKEVQNKKLLEVVSSG